MRDGFKAVLATLAIGALAGPAWAQGRGGGFGGMGMGGVNLIGNVGVQKELKLDEAQMQKATDFVEDNRERQREMFAKVGRLEGEERMKKMQELGHANTAEGMKVLSTFMKPEQVGRFEQILLQQRGAEALTDPKIAEKLKVTDEQSAKVKALMAEMRESMMSMGRDSGGDREAAMKKGQELRKETNSKAMALMTDPQKSMWKEMTGEPYEVVQERRGGGR